MGENSNISWTTHSFNPWMGCQRWSEGCRRCYAETLVTGRMGLPLWGPKADRQVTSLDNWKKPRKWNRDAVASGLRARVFCSSLADVFEDRPDLVEPRARLFRLIEETPHLDWLLLTKRPENMRAMAVAAGWPARWPDNVWAGCTVESQEMAIKRLPHILLVPARIRFLSCEPLLTRLDLSYWIRRGERTSFRQDGSAPLGAFCDHPLCPEEAPCPEHHRIDWVIVGGESGARKGPNAARAFDLRWAREIRDLCLATRTAFFMKQLGSCPVDSTHVAAATPPAPVTMLTTKGDTLADFPLDLQIQEFPPDGAIAGAT